MAKIDNYSFVEYEVVENWINPKDFDKSYMLVGFVTGRACFPDGSYIHSSKVESIEDGVVHTESGSMYELGEMSRDYRDFLESLKNGVPVIEEWDLEGSICQGYIIEGYSGGKRIRGEIVDQDGSFIRLKGDDKKYFVVWRNIGANPKMILELSREYCDLTYPDDFDIVAGFRCRPKLFRK